MTMTGGTWLPDDARRIARAVRKSEAGGPTRRRGGNGGGAGQWARIVSNDGSGAYTVTLQVWDTEAETFADVGDESPAAVNACAQDLNGLEHGTAEDVVPCWVVRDSDDETLFLVDVSPNLDHSGTEQVILPSTFETEAAQSDTWSRSSPTAGKTGLEMRVQTRTAYDDTSDEKLYAYYRTLTYDVWGRLASVSAETRVVVDTPEAC